MEATINKEQLRKSLKELAGTEPDFVSNLLAEINEVLQQNKKQRLQKIIQEDFNEYGEVFKALA